MGDISNIVRGAILTVAGAAVLSGCTIEKHYHNNKATTRAHREHTQSVASHKLNKILYVDNTTKGAISMAKPDTIVTENGNVQIIMPETTFVHGKTSHIYEEDQPIESSPPSQASFIRVPENYIYNTPRGLSFLRAIEYDTYNQPNRFVFDIAVGNGYQSFYLGYNDFMPYMGSYYGCNGFDDYLYRSRMGSGFGNPMSIRFWESQASYRTGVIGDINARVVPFGRGIEHNYGSGVNSRFETSHGQLMSRGRGNFRSRR